MTETNGTRKLFFTLAAFIAATLVFFLTPARAHAEEPESPSVSVSSQKANQITVSWTSVSGATAYKVYRCDKSSPYQLIASTSQTTYQDNSVENDKAYEYSVTAVVDGEETPFQDKGALGYTSYKAAHIYNWQVKDLTPWSFTVSGKVSYAGAANVLYLPVWTEADGQDDLRWYTVSISNNSFSYTIYTSNHGSQRGVYVLDPYLNGTSIYCQAPLWVEVPAGQVMITAPEVVALSSNGFTATAIAKAFNNHVKSVKAEIWTAYHGTDDLETVTASYDSATGVISCPVNISRHNNESFLYYVRFTVTDGAGNSKSLQMSAYVPAAQKCMSLTVIDLGEGNIGGSATLLTSGGKGFLIDTGRSESADAVVASLKQHKLSTVDIIITHGDGDHVGVAQAIIDAGISIGTVYTDQYPTDVMWDELDRRNSMAVFKKYAKIAPIPDTLTIGDATLTTIGPVKHYSLYEARANGSSMANANSYWFMITNGSRKVLINGDSEIASSSDMVKSGRDVSADLYILGHHGAANSLNEEILSAIAPKWTAASGRITDAINSDTISKLKKAGVPYYFTGNYGTIDFSFRGELVTINTERNTSSATEYYKVIWKNANGSVLETDNYVKRGQTPSYNGQTPTLAKTAQYTFTFLGWSTDGKTILSEFPSVTNDLTFVAVYKNTVNQYKITWKNVDGTILGETIVPYGTMPEFDSVPEYPANDAVTYTFDGWNPALHKVTGAATYTATFTALSPKLQRLFGETRYETAQEILHESFEDGSQERLLLTSGTSYQYAIAGIALAGAYNCPLLITGRKSLSDAAREEIIRLAAENCEVLIIGGEDVISPAVEEALLEIEKVTSVSRVAEEADDVSEAALEIYGKGMEEGLWTNTGTVIIASGQSFPDGLSIAPYANAAKIPILFTNGGPDLSESVYETLFREGVRRVILVGGSGVVSKAAEDRLSAGGMICVRLAGADRYQTAEKVFDWLIGEDEKAAFQPEATFTPSYIGFATGKNYPDAIMSANLLGLRKSPLLLVSENTDAIETMYRVLEGHENQVLTAYIFGGAGVVSNHLAARIADAVTEDIE